MRMVRTTEKVMRDPNRLEYHPFCYTFLPAIGKPPERSWGETQGSFLKCCFYIFWDTPQDFYFRHLTFRK
jgi:hypothetical protein